MSEKMPQHVPSSEEFKKAEKSMTSGQKEASEAREKYLSKFENIDKQIIDELASLKKDIDIENLLIDKADPRYNNPLYNQVFSKEPPTLSIRKVTYNGSVNGHDLEIERKSTHYTSTDEKTWPLDLEGSQVSLNMHCTIDGKVIASELAAAIYNKMTAAKELLSNQSQYDASISRDLAKIEGQDAIAYEILAKL